MIKEQHKIELEHIQLEIKHGRLAHLRSFIDQWFCHKYGYVNKSGTANWGKIVFSEYVSESAIGKSLKEVVHKEHIVPIKVIAGKLKELGPEASIQDIEKVLEENVLFATITHEEDAILRKAGLNHKMPEEYYEIGHPWYNDPFVRYKKIGLVVAISQKSSVRG